MRNSTDLRPMYPLISYSRYIQICIWIFHILLSTVLKCRLSTFSISQILPAESKCTVFTSVKCVFVFIGHRGSPGLCEVSVLWPISHLVWRIRRSGYGLEHWPWIQQVSYDLPASTVIPAWLKPGFYRFSTSITCIRSEMGISNEADCIHICME